MTDCLARDVGFLIKHTNLSCKFVIIKTNGFHWKSVKCWQTCGISEILEELLVEDEGHTADLFYFGFSCGVAIDEVRCDRNREFTTEFFPAKPYRKEKAATLRSRHTFRLSVPQTVHSQNKERRDVMSYKLLHRGKNKCFNRKISVV